MVNYFIVHGSFSNPYANWFPWLASEIEKTKLAEMEEPICYVPQFPTGVGKQTYDNWEKVMLAYIDAGLITQETTIFAHSIAPAFVCKFLIKHSVKVKRLVFVSGFNNYFGVSKEYDEVNKTMFTESIEKVKDLAEDIVCVYSNNDPYVDFEAEDDFAKKVSNKQIVIDGGGHLNAGSGYTEFPMLLKYIG